MKSKERIGEKWESRRRQAKPSGGMNAKGVEREAKKGREDFWLRLAQRTLEGQIKECM